MTLKSKHLRMAAPKNSLALNYFATSEQGTFVTCNICGLKMKCKENGSIHNLLRHLHCKHPSSISQSMDISGNANGYGNPRILSTENIPTFRPIEQDISSDKMQVSSNISNNSHQTRNFVKSEDLKLIHPFSLIISGPTSSGMSTLLFQILENLHENTKPSIKKSYFHLWGLSRCL